MEKALGDREAFLCREATKLHEEYVLDNLSGIQRKLEAREAIRGEIVLVVSGATERAGDADLDFDATVRVVEASGVSGRALVKDVARRLGLPAREVYARLLVRPPQGEKDEASNSGR